MDSIVIVLGGPTSNLATNTSTPLYVLSYAPKVVGKLLDPVYPAIIALFPP